MNIKSDDHLRAVLFDAFASRPRPEEDEVLRPPVDPGEGSPVRELLAAVTVTDLSSHDIRTVIEGNLWMLDERAFRYFLPAFMHASLSAYAAVSVFASELLGALTPPSREAVAEAIDRLADPPVGPALPDNLIERLREQQLDWFDSGTPTAIFVERVDDLTDTEGGAVLAFLDALKDAFGADFPFDEIDLAIDSYWTRYRGH